MAGSKRPSQRIEPQFEGSRTSAPNRDMRLSNEERAVPARSTSAQPAAKKPRKAKSKKAARQSRGLFGFLKVATYWSFVLGIWAGIGLSILVGYYAVKLPQASDWKVPQRPPNAKILSVDGELIANRGATGGASAGLDQMSPYIPMAVIAIEDRRFKSHFGVDPLGIARAVMTNLVTGRLVQGGSTITQQLAKNLFLEPKRNLERKIQEAILSIWLEQKFSKDEILELYLNRVYFGSGAYGVDAASRRYFSKSARDVNLAEAALLAGLLKAPSTLSPARNPKGAEERAQIVLGAMRREGFVTDSEVTTALTMEAKKAKSFWSGSEHYVADYVMTQLPALIGEIRTDVIIDTTIDLSLQKQAGRIIRETVLSEGAKLNVSQGALVSLDGTGAVRALVGGSEYADSQFNRVTDARRQPGSAFKPIVYTAAMEAGLTPDTVRVDRPFSIGTWSPENYDKKFRGPVTLSEALSQSLNTIAAQMVSEVGTKNVLNTALKLGIQSKLAKNASIALGTSETTLLELTSAYAPFANGGYLAEPFVIKRITASTGEVLYERNATNAPKILKSGTVGMMNEMLRRTVEEGTGKSAQIKGWQVAGKTGTTQNFRDALFVGYTVNLITGVWFGNDDGTPTKKVTGGNLPAKAFSSFMTLAHKGVPVGDLPGVYLPQSVSIIPTPSPRSGADDGGRNDVMERIDNVLQAENATGRQNSPKQRVDQPLSDITTGTPVPGADIGQSGKKPKNILDILFGK